MPEAFSAGTAFMIWERTTGPSVRLTLQAQPVARLVSCTWDTTIAIPSSDCMIASIANDDNSAYTGLDTGLYTVRLLYQDTWLNPPAFATPSTEVLIEAVGSPPILRITASIGTAFSAISGPTQLAAFATAFVNQVASALGCPTTQLRFQSATAADASSTTVVFDILPAVSSPIAQQNNTVLLAEFNSQFANPSSALRTGTYTFVASAGTSSTEICLNEAQVIIGCPGSPAPNTGDGGGNDTTRWIIVGVVVGLLVIMIIIGIVLHCLDKKKRDQKDKELEDQLKTANTRNAATFDEMDVNHDGTVTKDEFIKFTQAHPGQVQPTSSVENVHAADAPAATSGDTAAAAAAGSGKKPIAVNVTIERAPGGQPPNAP